MRPTHTRSRSALSRSRRHPRLPLALMAYPFGPAGECPSASKTLCVKGGQLVWEVRPGTPTWRRLILEQE